MALTKSYVVGNVVTSAFHTDVTLLKGDSMQSCGLSVYFAG